MPRILITPRSLTKLRPAELKPLEDAGYELVFAPAGQTPTPEDLIALLPGCAGWLAGVEPVPPEVIRATADLRAISRNGVGVDNLPIAECEARGIAVLRAEGANAIGVAELAISMMLALLRRIPQTDASVKAGGWLRESGGEINGRTVGIVGMGAIGSHVARIVTAMGARVIGCDPFPRNPGLHPALFHFAPLEEMLAASDIVTLHAPGHADGRPLLDAAALARLPRGAMIVNTARASLVDEAALLAALDNGTIGGYGTDVFPQEPPADLTLAGHPRVIATSHIGALTAESVSRATEIAVANLLAALARKALA